MAGLDRFLAAQANEYETALRELKSGAKRSHWMWYVFPQVAGLGHSAMARHFAIRDLEEAEAYLAHDVLGPRLVESCEAMLGWAGKRTAPEILGQIDAMKFRSSMTLFERADPDRIEFGQAIDAFYDGKRDERTLAFLTG